MNYLLNRIGEALFGAHWRTPLAVALDVNERTVRRWVSEEVKIPLGVWKEIFIKLDVKRDEINYLIERTKEHIDAGK